MVPGIQSVELRVSIRRGTDIGDELVKHLGPFLMENDPRVWLTFSTDCLKQLEVVSFIMVKKTCLSSSSIRRS